MRKLHPFDGAFNTRISLNLGETGWLLCSFQADQVQHQQPCCKISHGQLLFNWDHTQFDVSAAGWRRVARVLDNSRIRAWTSVGSRMYLTGGPSKNLAKCGAFFVKTTDSFTYLLTSRLADVGNSRAARTRHIKWTNQRPDGRQDGFVLRSLMKPGPRTRECSTATASEHLWIVQVPCVVWTVHSSRK